MYVNSEGSGEAEDFAGLSLAGIKLRVCIKNYFLISQPKHMLCVLRRIVSMRQFF